MQNIYPIIVFHFSAAGDCEAPRTTDLLLFFFFPPSSEGSWNYQS